MLPRYPDAHVLTLLQKKFEKHYAKNNQVDTRFNAKVSSFQCDFQNCNKEGLEA